MTSNGPRGARPDQVLRWDPGLGRFCAEAEAELGALDVADSWLLEDGAARALPQHRERFVAACAQRGVADGGSTGFFDAACAALPGTGRWFPRVEYRTRAGFHVRLRPAPARSEAVILGVADGPDPRRAPRVKGPDLERLVELRARAAIRVGADEVVLRSGDGLVLEGAVSGQRRLIVIAFQHDIYVSVVGLVQGVELVARLVGLHLGLQRLHGRLEVGVGAGLDGQFGDDAEHGRSPYIGRFLTRYLCSPSQTSTPA